MKNLKYNKYDSGNAFFLSALLPQVFAFFVVIIIGLVAALTKKDADSMLNSITSTVIMAIIAQLTFVFLVLYYNKKRKMDWKIATGFSFKLNILNVLAAIVIPVVAIFCFDQLSGLFQALVSLTGYVPSANFPLPLDNGFWLVFNLIFLALIPAIFEELIFRGIILNGFLHRGKTTALIFSALLFALIHGNAVQFIYPIILGLIIGLIYLKTKNIVYCMIVHFVNNAFVIILNFINTSSANLVFELTWLNALYAILFAMLGCVVIYLIIKFIMQSKKETTKAENIHLDSIDANEHTYNNKVNKFLIIGIIFAVMIWIIDFISNLTT